MSAAEKLMTFREAAKQCECSPKTLRRAVESGDLAVVRLGSSAKSDRIHPADLAAFWARKRTCQSESVPTPGLGKLPSVGADERLDALLHAGRGSKRAPSSANSFKSHGVAQLFDFIWSMAVDKCRFGLRRCTWTALVFTVAFSLASAAPAPRDIEQPCPVDVYFVLHGYEGPIVIDGVCLVDFHYQDGGMRLEVREYLGDGIFRNGFELTP